MLSRSFCSGLGFTVARRISQIKRAFSTSRDIYFKPLKIPCGVYGHTTIHVHNPPASEPLPLLLYIRPIPVPELPVTTDEIPISFLGDHHTTVVISPTWCRTAPFPQSLHLLSYAYCYILKQHALASEIFNKPGAQPWDPEPIVCPPIAVYSSGLGGSLAMTLALLECKPSNSATGYIDAIMTRDSIFDFSPLTMEYLNEHRDTSKRDTAKIPESYSEYLSPDSDLAYTDPPSNHYISSSAPPEETPISLQIPTKDSLFKLLPRLFSKPEVAYDASVSPLLFFRGTDHSTPGNWSWTDPPRSSLHAGLKLTDRSRSYYKFPSRGSGLRIPWTRLCVSGTGSEQSKPVPKKKRGRPRKGGMETVTQKVVSEPVHESEGLEDLFGEQADLMASSMRRSIDKQYEDPKDVGDLQGVGSDERVEVAHGGSLKTGDEEGVTMLCWLVEKINWLDWDRGKRGSREG